MRVQERKSKLPGAHRGEAIEERDAGAKQRADRKNDHPEDGGCNDQQKLKNEACRGGGLKGLERRLADEAGNRGWAH